MDRLFRQSGLDRHKWHARADYRERTFDRAFARRGPRDFYDPRRRIDDDPRPTTTTRGR